MKWLFTTLIIAGLLFWFSLLPVNSTLANPHAFSVQEGEGFVEIVTKLKTENLIRSRAAFGLLAIIEGKAKSLKPGVFELSPASSSIEILGVLTRGAPREVEVRIPDGASIYEIDTVLSKAGVLKRGELVHATGSLAYEGRYYPDTYRFFAKSSAEEVIQKFLDNFKEKAPKELLQKSETQIKHYLILASLIQREVPELADGKVVAGILEKRLANDIPLQIDATICYIKIELAFRALDTFESCYPLEKSDLKISSPLNTYLNRDLPAHPIGNPTRWAIEAALSPQKSPYLYYVSDPETGKTIFAKTLEEHNRNVQKYLR